MTTENQVEDDEVQVEEGKVETVQETTPAPSPIEEKARSQGWVSKDEWVASGKHPDEWRSAREYAERGELFEEIHKLKEDGKQTSRAFRALVEHHKKVRETAVKEALEQLKAQRREAMLNHDLDVVEAIEEKMEQVKTAPADLPDVEIPEQPKGPTPTFKAWHKKNSWYELQGDHEESRIADVIGATFKKNNPDATEEEFLEHVEKRIAKRFPELFENKTAPKTPEVGSNSGNKTGSGDSFKLTPEEERICKQLVEQDVMTRKEYIDEIKKVRSAQ